MAGQDKITLVADTGQMQGPNQAKSRNKHAMNYHVKRGAPQNGSSDANKAQKTLQSREQKDLTLDSVLQQLYFLESKLRKEQKEIWNLLAQRDHTILVQRQELDKLRRENKKLLSRGRKPLEIKADSVETDRIKLNPTNDSSASHKSNGCGRDTPKHNYNLYDTKDSKRVCHKPPIAEKPKLNPSGYIVTTCALKTTNSSSKGVNIASTISQLLNEEPDHGIVLSSGGSEPSSPESTLKQSLPKVVKIGRSQDKSSEENNLQILVMDEHEVTSGYNSDTVSEQDHDYENIDLRKPKKSTLKERQKVLTATSLSSSTYLNSEQDKSSSNHPIYSNIEYAEKRLREGSNVIEALNLQVGKVSSTPNNGSTTKRKNLKPVGGVAKTQNCSVSKNNVPRNRGNISQLIEAEDKHVIMQNFEEFSLDSLDLDSYEQNYIFGKENSPVELTRHSGDGAESKNIRAGNEMRSSSSHTSGGYEKFLEATGLSQKSILTPSRMLSNHRSMLKPRDIKHRNKLRVYFTGLPTLEEGTISQSESKSRKNDKKYWREPFL